jgi:hypothetical protein
LSRASHSERSLCHYPCNHHNACIVSCLSIERHSTYMPVMSGLAYFQISKRSSSGNLKSGEASETSDLLREVRVFSNHFQSQNTYCAGRVDKRSSVTSVVSFSGIGRPPGGAMAASEGVSTRAFPIQILTRSVSNGIAAFTGVPPRCAMGSTAAIAKIVIAIRRRLPKHLRAPYREVGSRSSDRW